MIGIFDALREITVFSVCLRMVLAAVCGGAVGLEREFKRRPAGFRTHILICVGAAMTTMTSQYLCFNLGYTTDLGRIGAQVVAGIGFIGAGTIMVTARHKVLGLTTAAGLWAAAIVGLALGAGFYEGGLTATLLILMAEMLFSRLEYRMLETAPEVNLYIEYAGSGCLEALLKLFRERDLRVLNMNILHTSPAEKHCAAFTLRLDKATPLLALMERISNVPGVASVQEL